MSERAQDGQPKGRRFIDLVIPISPGWYVPVSFPEYMTEDEWQRFWAVLGAMKPGVVQEVPDDQS